MSRARDIFRKYQGRILAVAMALLISSVLFNAFGKSALIEKTNTAEQQRDQIIEAQVQTCKLDTQFRRQYRIRAVAERQLLVLFLSLAQKNVAAGGKGSQTSKDFITQFAPLTSRIKIRPLPDCDALRQELLGG